MTEEKKEGLLAKINTAFKKISNDLFDGLDAKIAFDIAAIIGTVLGAVLLGIGIQFVNGIFIVPGFVLLIMGIFRFIFRIGGFTPSRY